VSMFALTASSPNSSASTASRIREAVEAARRNVRTVALVIGRRRRGVNCRQRWRIRARIGVAAAAIAGRFRLRCGAGWSVVATLPNLGCVMDDQLTSPVWDRPRPAHPMPRTNGDR